MSGSIEFTDRYDAVGHRPDPATICPGQCEGLGCYPVNVRDQTTLTQDEQREVLDALERGNTEDEIGYLMIRCSTCKGTGKRPTA